MVTNEKIPLILSPFELQALEELLLRLRQTYGNQIQQAFLFGSRARGDYHNDSDIDVLLLVEQETWVLKDDISGLQADINLSFDMAFDLRVIGINRWRHMAETQAGLFQTVSADAIPLPI